jgi:hypothetical protein
MKLLLVGFERRRSMATRTLAQVAAVLVRARRRLLPVFASADTSTPDRRASVPGRPDCAARFGRSCAWAPTSMRLLWARITGSYDLVIACDNVAFVVASRLFPRVALWSFDFMTPERERPSGAALRTSRSRVASMLRRNRRLIIQDRDRLELFCETFLGTSARRT